MEWSALLDTASMRQNECIIHTREEADMSQHRVKREIAVVGVRVQHM